MKVELYAFPDRIFNEIEKHNQSPNEFVIVGVNRETGEVEDCLWPISLAIKGTMILGKYSPTEKGSVESFYRVTRVDFTTFQVEHLVWEVGERTATDITGPEAEAIPTGKITMKYGRLSAVEFCRLYLRTDVQEYPVSEYNNAFSNFIKAKTYNGYTEIVNPPPEVITKPETPAKKQAETLPLHLF